VGGGGTKNRSLDQAVSLQFNKRDECRTHWMEIPPLPKPKELTQEEKALKEFETRFGKVYDLTKVDSDKTQVFKFNAAENAWIGFKAAKGL
jgi:acyl-CoA thioesterase